MNIFCLRDKKNIKILKSSRGKLKVNNKIYIFIYINIFMMARPNTFLLRNLVSYMNVALVVVFSFH